MPSDHNNIQKSVDSFVHRTDIYTTYRNIGIVLMVIGGILLIPGIIFAIKSERRGKSIPPVGSYYNSAAAPQTVCGHCGGIIPPQALYCPRCGAPSASPYGGKQLCPSCQTENNADADFCRNCGAQLRQR